MKYPRSMHSVLSQGTTSDDRIVPVDYWNHFLDAMARTSIVVTEKLDGQNTCLKEDGVFARSHVAPSEHPWDRPIWQLWESIRHELKGLEVFGESMYGIHSIEYSKLRSFYYIFAVRINDQWLRWDEVQMVADVLNLPTVPVLYEGRDLDEDEGSFYSRILGRPWYEWVESEGSLGGSCDGKPACEGLVVRTHSPQNFPMPEEYRALPWLLKLVRKKHVKTDVHWTKTWRPARLQSNDYAFQNTYFQRD